MSDPTNDKLYALISAAVTGLVTAILAFCPFTGEQKAAVIAAAGTCGTLVATIFLMSHTTNVRAEATKQAAAITASDVPDNHPKVALVRAVSYQQGFDDGRSGKPLSLSGH